MNRYDRSGHAAKPRAQELRPVSLKISLIPVYVKAGGEVRSRDTIIHRANVRENHQPRKEDKKKRQQDYYLPAASFQLFYFLSRTPAGRTIVLQAFFITNNRLLDRSV